MTDSGLSADDLKNILRATKMIEANLENWTYTQVNAEYLPPKQVADALGQILSLTKPIIANMRSVIEIEAITTLDPIDLID